MKRYRSVWLGLIVAAACGAALSVYAEKSPATLPSMTLGTRAPELAATDLAGKPVTLDTFKGKPAILQFGSLTEPVFRKHAADTEKLATAYADKAVFVVIYQHEAHAADGPAALELNMTDGYALAAPVSQDERLKLAASAVDRLGLKHQQMAVDAFNDATSRRYGNRPNMTFIIDANGALAAAYPWMDPKKVRGALDAVLAGKVVPPEFQGPVHTTTMPAAAFESGAGGRLSLALALDNIEMSDKQKEAIIPPLTELLTELREFRETRGEQKDGKDADDLQVWIKRLRETHAKVRTAIKDNLSDPDGKTMLDALNRTIPPRLINAIEK